MKHSSRLPAVTASVTGARDFVTNSLESVPKDVLDAVLVVASELTSNSVLHGGSSFEITVEQFSDRIVVEVQDDGGGEPVIRSPGPSDTSGRGLQITRALAETWGVRHTSGSIGKTVWAVVLIPPSPSRDVAREHGTQGLTAQEEQPSRSIDFAVRTQWRPRLALL